MDFKLTQPENRTYLPDEDYRFLVHIPLGDVSTRMNEIGSDRDGALMTSLISNEHQGTFLGRGGIIVDQPEAESVIGTAREDVGAEIPAGRYESVDDLITPATPFTYNQIDMKFSGTKPIGVLIKCDETGADIGDSRSNTALRHYAAVHNLPVSSLVVEAAHVPTKVDVRKTEFPDDKGSLDTITIPYTDAHFLRVDIRRIGNDNAAYHTDADRFSRASRIDVYGQTNEMLTDEERLLVTEQLNKLVEQSALSSEDLDAVQRDMVPLVEKDEA